MLNYLWGFMILIGVTYGALQGKMQAITEAILGSAKEGVALCITMLGVMALWCGVMEIAQKSGLIAWMARKMRPFLHFLFPRVPKDHPALEQISMNMISNFLGLGWAATPAGLKAMEALEELEEERRQGQGRQNAMPRGVANNEMCTFLILNISSLQLIPVNMIAYRSQYGSVNPTAIVGPAIVATAVSTAAAIVFCRWMDRK
ncbi:MAG: nucleoside recognition domain-containing protein [Lachnospiraceae bacterium]|nr:nucleoside recognition domain-containing protein [Lachnospiraceae bacterium]